MTISYQRDVASSTAGGFTRLLFKWKVCIFLDLLFTTIFFNNSDVIFDFWRVDMLWYFDIESVKFIILYVKYCTTKISIMFKNFIKHRKWQQKCCSLDNIGTLTINFKYFDCITFKFFPRFKNCFSQLRIIHFTVKNGNVY